MTDADTAAAIESLAYRLRQRDEAMRNGGDHADPDVFALEFLTAMRGKGWRHLEALVGPKPVPDGVTGTDSRRSAELLAPLRAQLDELNATKRAAIEEGAA